MAEPDVPVRDAATVMLVRDGADPATTTDSVLEVFMLRRSTRSVFAGGAYVFPGGAVDEADRHLDLESVCAGRSDDQASALLEVDAGGLAYWVAAVRECFEEAGVLLAVHDDGSVVSFADPDVARRFEAHRAAVDSGELRLVELCHREGLTLAAGSIHYFAHWITPVGAPRRFDTRFFVAATPPEQVPLHDDRETVANLWVRPLDALERQRTGELEMILPTIENLKAISRFHCAADLLAAASVAADVPTMLPRVATAAEGQRILLPGDVGYEQAGTQSGG